MAWVRAWTALPLLLAATVACSSSVEPRPGVTLLVTNATCGARSCSPLQILGFPSNQPATPGGMWSLDLGLVTTSSACLTLPASATFNVVGPGTTKTYSWTTANGLSLGAEPPSASRIQAAPSTGMFVPARAAGWTITLPGGAAVSAAKPCGA